MKWFKWKRQKQIISLGSKPEPPAREANWPFRFTDDEVREFDEAWANVRRAAIDLAIRTIKDDCNSAQARSDPSSLPTEITRMNIDFEIKVFADARRGTLK
jgi:hypothetical protein